jgi:hypothetical protein
MRQSMQFLLPQHVEAIKTAYFVASSRFFTFTMSTMHGHMNIKSDTNLSVGLSCDWTPSQVDKDACLSIHFFWVPTSYSVREESDPWKIWGSLYMSAVSTVDNVSELPTSWWPTPSSPAKYTFSVKWSYIPFFGQSIYPSISGLFQIAGPTF